MKLLLFSWLAALAFAVQPHGYAVPKGTNREVTPTAKRARAGVYKVVYYRPGFNSNIETVTITRE